MLPVVPAGGSYGGVSSSRTVLGPLEHSVLEMTLDGGHSDMTIDEEPLARSVLDVALDGRPMEGIPVLEPLEHSGKRTHGGDVRFRTVGAFGSKCSPRRLV